MKRWKLKILYLMNFFNYFILLHISLLKSWNSFILPQTASAIAGNRVKCWNLYLRILISIKCTFFFAKWHFTFIVSNLLLVASIIILSWWRSLYVCMYEAGMNFNFKSRSFDTQYLSPFTKWQFSYWFPRFLCWRRKREGGEKDEGSKPSLSTNHDSTKYTFILNYHWASFHCDIVCEEPLRPSIGLLAKTVIAPNWTSFSLYASQCLKGVTNADG